MILVNFEEHNKIFAPSSSSVAKEVLGLGPCLETSNCATLHGGFVMWRNWHQDEITLILSSDLKEYELFDLINTHKLADIILVKLLCNNTFYLALTVYHAFHSLSLV